MKSDPRHDKTPIKLDATADGEMMAYRHLGAVCVELGEYAFANRMTFDHLRNAIVALLEEAKRPHLVLDLHHIDSIRSEVIGLLVALSNKAGERGGAIALVGAKPEVRQVLNVTKLAKKIPICDDVNTAVRSFKKPWWKFGR